MTAFAVAVWLALLGVSAAVAWWVWGELGAVSIGLHGWIALGLGVVATLAVGGVLVLLMHHSARRGFDDDVGRGE